MRVAVIGGGINGIMSAWELARRGAKVQLLERDALVGQTSSASTKLLHGGLRYLESGHLRLVRKGLKDRAWWLKQAPHIARPIEILIPVYVSSRRARWQYALGLKLYGLLSGGLALGSSQWLDAHSTQRRLPAINTIGLLGSYSFFDGQMDDRALGLWAAEKARDAGACFRLGQEVLEVTTAGDLVLAGHIAERYDRIVNTAGPWAADLLARSGVDSRFSLDLVRGSHLLVSRQMPMGVLLEVPDSTRICFALPYQGNTLIGTTEVVQGLTEPIACSDAERRTLIDVYNRHLSDPVSETDILSEFAGIRPLLRLRGDASSATRDYAIDRQNRLVSVFGGKWTTSRSLAEEVAHVTLADA